jgi:2-keto-4-pentenoate hydratase
MTDRFEAAAAHLLRAHDDGVAFTSLSAEFGIADVEGAYRIQDRFVSLLEARHGVPCGYKIGLTSEPMQKMCGIDHPIAGVVLARRILASGARVPVSAHGHAGIEFEIAVRMGAGLGGAGGAVTREDVAAAVDGVCAAFEIVDDRKADYSVLDVLTLVADNSWNAACVLGSFVAPPANLADVTGTVTKNGAEIASGQGRAALGHPYEPVRWLADHLGARGGTLRKGDIVMTGSLVPTQFPQAGDRFAFAVEGLGTVDVHFTP